MLPPSIIKDHLHIRGEYEMIQFIILSDIGSSPHTWRILYHAFQAQTQVKDHLHIRGEYRFYQIPKNYHVGSSPHTWRILLKSGTFLKIIRIISTYVENTNLKINEFMGTEDHLHIRGEYVLGFVALKDRLGSSPHTWRIRIRVCSTKRQIRIISTYVENTKQNT